MADPKIRYDILANAEGAESVDKLAVELEKLDKAFDPAVAARAQALANELRDLGAQQAAIERFRELKEQTAAASIALDTAQAAAQKLGQQLAASDAPTRAQTGQMQKLRDAVQAAKDTFQAETSALDVARGNLTQFGISTDEVASKSIALRTAMQGTRQEVQNLGEQGQAVQRFKDLAAATETARAALVAADGAVETFKREIANADEPTRAEAQQLARLAESARLAQVAFQNQAQTQAQAGTALRAAGVDTERFVTAQARARTETAATAVAATNLAGAYRAEATAATQSAAEQGAAHRKIRDGVSSINDQLNQLKTIGIAGILGSQTAQLLKTVGETADAYANLSARVRLVTGDEAGFQAAMAGIFEVAKRSSSALDSTATLFTRIAQAGREIGVGQKDALALTESINQAIQLSGGSAESADAAVTQLIQGLQSGVLRGEEFNSVMEQAPRLAQALAAGLHVTTGELRNLSKEGALTSATVVAALRDQSATLQKEFGSLPATLGRSVTNLSTEWTKFIGTLNSSSGATATVAAGIDAVAKHLDQIAAVAERAGAVLVTALAIKSAAALRTFAVEATAAAGSANLLSASISKIPTVVNITIAAIGFEIGFQIGEMLYDNSELARKLGVGLVAFFENIVNDLRLTFEAAKAIFTDDTVDAAFERYRTRGKELDETFGAMWKDAEAAPSKIAAAADQAGTAIDKMGTAGATSGAQVTSGAAGAATSVGAIGHSVETATAALQALATAAKLNLPAVGLSAAAQAKQLIDLALKSKAATEVLRDELPAAIAKLSGPELEAFRSGFARALEESINGSRRLAAELRATGQSGFAALAGVEQKAQLLKQALTDTGQRAAQALGVDVVTSSTKITKGFQEALENLSILIRTLPQLAAAGIDTGALVAQALSKMIDGAKNQAELDIVIGRLNVLGKQGVVGPNAVADAMKQAAAKATELKQRVEDATPGIQSLGEAARKAGVDIGELTTGISKDFKDSVASIDALAQQIEKAGISAERASPLLAKALDQRIAAAQTKEEVQLLREETEKLHDAGKLLGIDYSAALDQIKAKAEALSPALRQAQADAKRLGVELKDGVEQGAKGGVEGAITAYERLKSSGKASSEELKTAFVNMANELIKANGGVVSEWLKVEAATRGATIAVDEFGNATVSSVGKANEAVKNLVGSLSSVSDAAEKAREAAMAAANANNATNQIGNGTNGGFGTLANSDGQLNVPEGSSFDEARYERDMAAYFKTGGSSAPHFKPPNPQDYVTANPTIGTGSRLPGNGTGAGTSLYVPKTTPTAAPASATPTAAATSTTHTVNVTINGQRQPSVNGATAGDATALVSLLKSLESVARRSSGAQVQI